jgi:4-amino-4-deoxy-L-arabinose transferase-like glycosyltransferase
MNTSPEPTGECSHPYDWFRDAEVLVLLLVVLAAFVVRLGDVSMRGEEPRRAQVAFELVERSDWIVPREQGEPFLSRPPFHNWLIALSTLVCGTRDAWAVRLPSVLALLLTVLLLYGYARTYLSRTGALAAGVAFLTLGEMFTTGCQAETEMVFISLVSGSLLLWHWGEINRWPETRTWVLCYLCVGLGVLTKGPQPPVYFLGTVGGYLLWTGQWRRLIQRPHLTGCLVGAALVVTWLVLVARQEGWPVVWNVVLHDSAGRMSIWKPGLILEHLVRYPVEVLGCTLPWSLLLLCYLQGDLRRSLARAHPQVVFLGICVGVAFPTCWIPPSGETRYFAPLYPCLALLIGSVVERCAAADVSALLARCWRWYIYSFIVVMLAAGTAVSLAPFVLASSPRYQPWLEQPLIALGYGAAMVILAVLCFRARQAGSTTRVRTIVLAGACFMVLTLAGIVTNIRVRRSEDQANAVARLKRLLPAGQRLVSLGHVDALFAYYYRLPIEAVSRQPADLAGRGLVYFCLDRYGTGRPALPFAWEEIAVISMERHHCACPLRAVVIGRCLPNEAATQTNQGQTPRS